MNKCPVCDGENITERMEWTPLPYGNPIEVTLNVLEPVLTCHNCDERWTDWRGEEIRTKAVENYLRTKK